MDGSGEFYNLPKDQRYELMEEMNEVMLNMAYCNFRWAMDGS